MTSLVNLLALSYLQRTQIYLDKQIIKLLSSVAKDTGKTRSELIREALREVYKRQDLDTALSKIKNLQSFSNSDEVKARKARSWSS